MPQRVPARRRVIKSISALLASGAISSGVAPFAIGQSKPTIRVLGTGVTLQDKIRRRAMADLGINIKFEVRDGASVLYNAVTQPQSFDVFEQWADSVPILWQTNVIQPIEKKRLTYWDELSPLTKTGKLTPTANIGAGDSPHSLLHIQDDNSLGKNHTELLSFVPYVHNVDSFGYNQQHVDTGVEYQTESWGWLLDERFSRLTAVVNAPTIGIFELALAAQAKGYAQFANIGKLTKKDLDTLFAVLIELKQRNHFSGFWNNVPESVEFMRSGRVIIQSMFSPAVADLKASGIPVRFAAPKEGYRGWHGVMCLSKHLDDRIRDVAYEYMNWWLSGWAGAFIARQGYYVPNPQRTKDFLSEAEWDYWYEGKPASKALRSTDNRISVAKGEVRSGGSYEKRLSHIAVWNTVLPNYEYSLQKWYEFITA